jgi:hypothetical protein
LQSIFGLQLSQPLVYISAVAVILLLLGIFAWVLRKISGNNSQSEGSLRGRQPRLGIVDTFQLDRQRQLVIIRRDSVEHLLLLGGTNDIVVEKSIVRSMAAQTQNRDTGAVSRMIVPPQSATATKSTGTSNPIAITELSFAQDSSFQLAPTMPSEVTPAFGVPKTSDLAEIANRFQTAGTKPMIADREVLMPAASTIPFTARSVMPLSTYEPDLKAPSELDSEAIIPAIERVLPPTEAADKTPEPYAQSIPSRDIGSLNDTLRQLLGRTREN